MERSIWVVDDDPGMQETLRDILADWGYSVSTFGQGKEFLKAFKESPVPVLLTDIKLPDISGLEVMQMAREIHPDVAVIIMSGYASTENAIRALNEGANAYILKPVHMEELKAVLKKAVREVRLSEENKQLIDRLQITNRSLENAKDELKHINQYLSALTQEMEDILHIVSHDLKAPLINIQGFTGRLEEEVVHFKEKIRKKLSDAKDFKIRSLLEEELKNFEKESEQAIPFIQKGVQKMDVMIQSLLKLSRVGRIADPVEDNDLNNIFNDVQGVFAHQLEKKKIMLTCNPLPHVRCRKNEINQVFSNLISNAINYMGDKSHKKIEVRSVSLPQAFQLSVSDNGIGIEEKNLEKIFKVFSRIGEIPVAGEGMGLAIIRKIIRGHGGKFWVESRHKEGSTFHFTLPKEQKDVACKAG